MIAVLLLLLGVTAVLSPSAIGVSAARRDIRVRLVIAQIISLVLGALLSVLVLDLPWWQTALAILPAGLWAAATQLSAPRATLGRWGTAIAVVAVCTALHDEPQTAAHRAAELCRGVGCLLLLTTPANHVITDLLDVARGRTRASRASGADSETHLRGGRWIGPLERLLLLLFASTGMHAAKGVIRFPEISKDEGGDKAEEFLIGSLASWTLAALVAVLLSR